MIRRLSKHAVLFLLGGLIYFCIEVLWRGYSHWTMAVLGGALFVIIGGLNNWFEWEMPFELQAIIGAIAVTVAEFISGCIINIGLGLNVWDYSSMLFNLLGQICLPYSILWMGLSAVAIVADDLLRWLLFGEQFPTYHFSLQRRKR